MRTLLRSLRHRLQDLSKDPSQIKRLVHSRWLLWRQLRLKHKHRLNAPLFVTLTSYPRRFPTLALTLKCLLMQSCEPDGVILWIADEDVSKLPRSVLALRKYGLTVRTCPDLRSYKKIIPALQERPDAFWATADDDCYYPPNWLSTLVQAWNPRAREVVCHRAHRITTNDHGLPAPYRSWVQELGTDSVHPLNFFTGVGGVLYPPGCFSPDVVNVGQLQELCPQGDDIWLWWMLRRNGYWVRKTGGPWPIVHWDGTQGTSLYEENVVGSGNDRAIEAMIRVFGFPSPVPTPANRAA